MNKVLLSFFLFAVPLIADIVTRDQVGQLLMTYIDTKEANEESYTFLKKYRPGGIILYDRYNGLTSKEQVKDLISGLQSQAKELGLPPLIIAVDQEGGVVNRLKQGFTNFPGNPELENVEDVERTAFLMGQELKEVGIHLNFAPVVDLPTHPNSPLKKRSYSSDPKIVAKLGAAAVKGFTKSGIHCCLKHFFAIGAADLDTHESLPRVEGVNLEAHLYPFKAIKAPAIMTAHVVIPKLDEKPITLSKRIVTNLLRNEIGYEGVVITDSLTMGAIVEASGDIAKAALQAFEAGNDILLIGGRTLEGGEAHLDELDAIQGALAEAIQSGQISENRLNDSFKRIGSLR